jgi:hypothetical protein
MAEDDDEERSMNGCLLCRSTHRGPALAVAMACLAALGSLSTTQAGEKAEKRESEIPAAPSERLEKPVPLEGRPKGQPLIAPDPSGRVPPSDHWIGVGCTQAPPALRAQLKLAESQGLVVETVAEKSPAAKAELHAYDVLLKADGKSLGSISALVEAVEAAKGRKLALELLREGKPMKIEVEPAARPAGPAARPQDWRSDLERSLRGDPHWEELGRMLEQMESMEPGSSPLKFRMMRPGVLLPPGAAELRPMPEDLKVVVTKEGPKPAKIEVTRKDQRWEVTEDDLDRLPADVRTHVENLLGRWCTAAMKPATAKPGSPDALKAPRDAAPKQLERELEDMNRQVERLRQMLDELRARQSREEGAQK